MQQNLEQRNSALTKRIMRRVYVVAAIRMLLNPLFLKSLIAAVLFWRSTAHISYAHVIANAPSVSDIKSNFVFFRAAAMHAEMTSAVLLIATLALVAWISLDMLMKRNNAWL
jgi:hypothetical protein